jgi:hypothetical protein
MLAPLAPFERQFEDQSWQSFLSIRAFENSLVLLLGILAIGNAIDKVSGRDVWPRPFGSRLAVTAPTAAVQNVNEHQTAVIYTKL